MTAQGDTFTCNVGSEAHFGIWTYSLCPEAIRRDELAGSTQPPIHKIWMKTFQLLPIAHVMIPCSAPLIRLLFHSFSFDPTPITSAPQNTTWTYDRQYEQYPPTTGSAWNATIKQPHQPSNKRTPSIARNVSKSHTPMGLQQKHLYFQMGKSLNPWLYISMVVSMFEMRCFYNWLLFHICYTLKNSDKNCCGKRTIT